MCVKIISIRVCACVSSWCLWLILSISFKLVAVGVQLGKRAMLLASLCTFHRQLAGALLPLAARSLALGAFKSSAHVRRANSGSASAGEVHQVLC